MSTLALIQEWAIMSAWMMAPLALILAARTRQSFGFVFISVLSFLGIWAVLGIPIGIAMTLLHNFDHAVVGAALLATAGAYQFSRRHEHAVLNCMETADSNLWFGLRTGWTCFVACGPLMIGAYAAMPNSPWLMLAITVVMVAEFTSKNRFIVARSVGLIAAVAAAGVLFLSGPISFGNFPTVGQHINH
jgi:predicted metal-binding membrane protein